MLGNVRYRYLEAGLFMFPLTNLLLPNLPDPAEYKAEPEYGQHSHQFKHSRIIGASPVSGAISFRRKLLTNG